MSKYIYLIKTKYWTFIYSILFKIKLKIYRVNYGNQIRAIGKTYVFKQKASRINIGSNCVFRSKEHSNLIGINRSCSLSTIQPDAEITIGDNCGFSGTVIGAFNSITIGDHVKCGANTLITDSDWHLDDPRSGGSKPIIIEDNVWLGEGVKILKGVTIGQNTMIGAGSIVVKNIPNNVIAAGNPCKVIRKLKK